MIIILIYMNAPRPTRMPSNTKPVAPAETQRQNIMHYKSRTLLNGNDRLWIEHNGERYTLRVTRQGKLILTK